MMGFCQIEKGGIRVDAKRLLGKTIKPSVHDSPVAGSGGDKNLVKL
jgi:hypothetical protein